MNWWLVAVAATAVVVLGSIILTEHREERARMAREAEALKIQRARARARSGPMTEDGDYRALVRQIGVLTNRVAELEAELEIRDEPDPILRALQMGPMTGQAIQDAFGLSSREREDRMGQLVWLDERVTRIEVPGADPVYTLNHARVRTAKVLGFAS